ncbi:GNAT family N-acetyltransferase [Pseudomonas sessilinigenes]|uniref:GNAT family N-acetyltransferase n=1 Tax=Pseudomonas sessilinigenes TaxID=658629 RepID=A0ABX8MVI4_9PSED|nr:GNAT family N-acetyltransferase [Pseudomonas sessilinigenes]AZC23144.1 Acetyltransferase, GNAT family [Pseudomonas sessilinigenes]QXH42161.1 GNAT family N-acetyltransferase [Pseudomonas sessilinigenes]
MTSTAGDSVCDLYHRAEDYFFVSISQFYRRFGADLSAYCTGVEASSLNLLIMKNQGPHSAAQLAEGVAFLQLTGMPFCVVVPEAHVAHVSEPLRQQQLLPADRTTCMVLDLEAYEAPQVSAQRMDIRCTDDCLEDWGLPVESAFESGAGGIEQYLARHRAALQSGRALRHFTLYVDQRPVSALTLSLGPAVARLDDIGTLQQCQGRGHATALIHHVLAFAKAQGAGTCVLEASLDGLSIYRKVGFKRLFDYRTFCQE